jgi:NSS family neurotransmitter:Na+ symporter
VADFIYPYPRHPVAHIVRHDNYASYLKGDENLVKTAGVGLIFITLPAVFKAIPLGEFFATLFFALLVVASLTSSISILEMPVAYLIEKKGFARPKAAIFVGGIGFVLGIAVSFGYGLWSHITLGEMTMLDVFDYLGSNVILPFAA